MERAIARGDGAWGEGRGSEGEWGRRKLRLKLREGGEDAEVLVAVHSGAWGVAGGGHPLHAVAVEGADLLYRMAPC